MKADVVIPTMGRPDGLDRAVRSLFSAENATAVQKLIVVDNDPAGSARNVASALETDAPFAIAYIHEPRAGVATARNAGVAGTSGATYLAFLDDDEVASGAWLPNLIQTAEALTADAVFGSIQGIAPTARPDLRSVVEAFFSRTGPNRAQVISRSYGCGNSLLRTSLMAGPDPFDISTNETGGEDDALFAKLAANGAVFAWAPDAMVEEHVPPHRATLRYLLTRAFARGQGPSQTAASQGRRGELLRWNAIGLGQAVVYSVASLATRLVSAKTSFRFAIKSAEGFGKMLWFKTFEPKLYGSGKLVNRPRPSGH